MYSRTFRYGNFCTAERSKRVVKLHFSMTILNLLRPVAGRTVDRLFIPFLWNTYVSTKARVWKNLISRNRSYYFITKGHFYEPLSSLEELSERSPKVANRTRIVPRFPKSSEDFSVESLTRRDRKCAGFRSRAWVLNQLGFQNKCSKNTFPVSFS